jgi:hypothetical protein
MGKSCSGCQQNRNVNPRLLLFCAMKKMPTKRENIVDPWLLLFALKCFMPPKKRKKERNVNPWLLLSTMKCYLPTKPET